QAGGVVLRAVDAQAGGQALDRGRQARAVGAQVALGVERHHVGVDDLRHFESPLSDSSRRVGLRKPWPDLRRGVINLTGAAAVLINGAGVGSFSACAGFFSLPPGTCVANGADSGAHPATVSVNGRAPPGL